MYEAFFGLATAPFSIAPDPRYLYMSTRHREALAHLLYGLDGAGGFVLLSGEIGTGKTTICRCLLEQVPPNCHVAYIFNPKLTELELLQSICDEFRISVAPASPTAPTVKDYIDPLNRYLLESHAADERCVLVIDEAQNLSADVLEQLRLLTNLETNERKLLQIILIGQPELRNLIARPELEQLAQRVTARFHLGALNQADTARYLAHRLGVAGRRGPLPFTREALRRLFQITQGVPRRINLLADRALLGAYASDQHAVTVEVIERAADEVFDRRKKSRLAVVMDALLPAPKLPRQGQAGGAAPARSLRARLWSATRPMASDSAQNTVDGQSLWPSTQPSRYMSQPPDLPGLAAQPADAAAALGAARGAAGSAGPDSASALATGAGQVPAKRRTTAAARRPGQRGAQRRWPSGPWWLMGGALLVLAAAGWLWWQGPGSSTLRDGWANRQPDLAATIGGQATAASGAGMAGPGSAAGAAAPTAAGTPNPTRPPTAAELPERSGHTLAVPNLPPFVPAQDWDALAPDNDPGWTALAALWRLDLPPGDTCMQAARLQVACHRGLDGTLDLLKKLDRPVVLRLTEKRGGRAGRVLLLGLNAERARVAVGEQQWTLSVGLLDRLWDGGYSTFWRMPEGYQRPVAPGTPGAAGFALAQGLAVRAGAASEPATVALTRNRLAALQRQNGLAVRAQAGPDVFMLLNRDLGVEEPQLALE